MTKYFTFQVRLHPSKHADLIAWLENATANNYCGIPHVVRELIANAVKAGATQTQKSTPPATPQPPQANQLMVDVGLAQSAREHWKNWAKDHPETVVIDTEGNPL